MGGFVTFLKKCNIFSNTSFSYFSQTAGGDSLRLKSSLHARGSRSNTVSIQFTIVENNSTMPLASVSLIVTFCFN
jgi:hypothetical protein